MLEQRTLTRRQTVARLAGVLAMAASIAAAPLPARADEANVLVFAAASLKNALDDVTPPMARRPAPRSPLLCRQLGAGQADRAGCAGHSCSSRPTSTGWTICRSSDLIAADTRRNLLGNSLVLVAPKDSKLGEVTIEPGLRSRQAARRRAAGDG